MAAEYWSARLFGSLLVGLAIVARRRGGRRRRGERCAPFSTNVCARAYACSQEVAAEAMSQSDEELLRACRAGDAAAWETLLRRYQRLVYAVPRRAGLDEDAAADVFQDVFATLIENVEKIEQPSRLHAWLVTTARRKTWLVIKRARSTQSLAGGEEEDEASSIPDEQLLPDEVLTQLEEQHIVRAA